MEGIGAEVSQKIRSAIKAKLMEIGVYVDEELPDYVMVMVANKRSKDQMDEDLQLFLGKHTSLFTTWLHQVLQKLQEVTVANLGGIKRKSSDDSKKKKKSKQDLEKKEPKKKIKIEPVDDKNKVELPKTKAGDKEKEDCVIQEDNDGILLNQVNDAVEPKRKENTDSRAAVEPSKETKIVTKTSKQLGESTSNTENQHKLPEKENDTGPRGKSNSTSSQAEDLDDEDCINIRTDGELLDTAEEINAEELSRKPNEKEDSTRSKSSDKEIEKKRTTLSRSPTRHKKKSKSEDQNNVEGNSKKETAKKQSSPSQSPTKTNDKVVDARELLNRKKAARQSDNRARTQSRERSMSPPRKRRDDSRKPYRDERDTNRRSTREDDRESSSRKVPREDERDRRGGRERDSYSVKRRGEDRPSRKTDSDRIDSRDSRRKDSSIEPPSKRVMLERPFRNKNDDWDSARSYKTAVNSESRKVSDVLEPSTKRRDSEEPRKRTGLLSRVVPRPQEPEEDVDAPVPSVVKVTPRPRRPPSQQPSSTLIMKAISEANKSLANVPQRPDSTQRARKEPIFTRTLRQLERIPPEKIAVSITNPLALQKSENSEVNDGSKSPLSPDSDGADISRSPINNNLGEVTSSKPDISTQNKTISKEVDNLEEKEEEESQLEEMQEPVLEIEPTPDLDGYDEPMDEMSDPQFVVTLNGYDPDGLYSQSELDLGEEGENDDWLKENMDEDPLLTSTPDEVVSPRPKRECNTSPVVIMNTPSINHSNLIEVELMNTKNTERCKYWPACRLADKCTFYHPSIPCKVFPACKFGDSCLYIHPQCKFNTLCTRKDCVFAHTPAHTPLQPAAVPKAKALYAASAPLPCRFYPNCTNINCQFAHPLRACRFGLYCTKKDCSFDHGQVAPVDKLKWTRATTT